MKIKLISLLTALVLLLALLPAVSAAGTGSGQCGPNAFWSYDSGKLTISGTGPMDDYLSSPVPWNGFRDEIALVSIEEGITSIGYAAFQELPALTFARFPASLERIGPWAFMGCANLTSAEIPPFVTEIGAAAFSETGLTRVSIPDGVTQLGNCAFSWCKDLEYVKLPAGLVRAQGGVFDSCTSLKTVLMPEMPNLESFGQHFFLNCDSLTDISFYTAPFLDGNMFAKCDGLVDVVIPEAVTAFCQVNWSHVFQECTNLKTVTIHPGVTVVGNASFDGCTSLEAVYFQGDAPEFGPRAFQNVTTTCYYPAGNATWTDAVLQQYGGTVTWLPEGEGGEPPAPVAPGGDITDKIQWSYDPAAATLTITGQGMLPDYSSGDEVPWARFRSRIEAVTVGEGITTIGNFLFADCAALAEVQLPASLLSIGNRAFYGCAALKEISLPETMNNIGSYAFSRSGLTHLELPDPVDVLGEEAFSYCTDLVSVKLPIGLMRGWGGVFRGCSSLTDIDMNERMSLRYFGISFFADCDALTDLSFYTLSFIDSYMFSGCDGLVDITIPDCVERINANPPEPVSFAFNGCSNLKTVTIPGSVRVIGSGAFNMCDSLEAIYFLGDAPAMEYNSLPGYPTKVYYPADNLSWTQAYLDTFSGINWVPLGKAFNPFNDVPESAYYYEPILWAVENKITSGTGEGVFSPDLSCTRAQVVTFLHRAAGSPEPLTTENPFQDVKDTDYFYKAVLWAVENKITSGMSANTFGPNEPCTRGQVVTFLHRAAGSPEPLTGGAPFGDVSADNYFHKAVLWAVENKITSGMSANTFGPNEPCTRGQVVTFLHRAAGSPEPLTGGAPFGDVSADNYFHKAVLWAVENQITSGTGNGNFSPNDPCTRGQVVTFLFRTRQ